MILFMRGQVQCCLKCIIPLCAQQNRHQGAGTRLSNQTWTKNHTALLFLLEPNPSQNFQDPFQPQVELNPFTTKWFQYKEKLLQKLYSFCGRPGLEVSWEYQTHTMPFHSCFQWDILQHMDTLRLSMCNFMLHGLRTLYVSSTFHKSRF